MSPKEKFCEPIVVAKRNSIKWNNQGDLDNNNNIIRSYRMIEKIEVKIITIRLNLGLNTYFKIF